MHSSLHQRSERHKVWSIPRPGCLPDWEVGVLASNGVVCRAGPGCGLRTGGPSP